MNNEATYWIALAHLPHWGYQKINNLIVKFFHENKITIEDFFNLDETIWKNDYLLNERQINDLKKAKIELGSTAFLTESLINQGFEIIPIISPEYSKTLKSNLKTAYSPAILYIKGNKKILEEKSIAIVGSRDASEKALLFTDNIAKRASEDFKVVVSGFAKGVDKQALDSAINYGGQSIIVLPQGIMTYSSWFKNYYKQIVGGTVLVMSVFFPKAPWKVELAMARNPIIYGLANEIFVAESSEKGGTWAGVIDGLKKGRKIYVRFPDLDEKNANNLLITKGAIPVDLHGIELQQTYDTKSLAQVEFVMEPSNNFNLEENIRKALTKGPLRAREILDILKLKWTQQQLKNYMTKLDFIEVSKIKRTSFYTLKNLTEDKQPDLFH